MDEEQPKKKITLNNFFESIQSADSKADRALRKTTSNLDLIGKNKSLIEGLLKSVKDIKSEVESIQKSISVNKDIEEDKLFTQEDQQQKIKRLERLQGIEGDKIDPADKAAGTTDDSEFEKKAGETFKKALQNPDIVSILTGLIGLSVAGLMGAGGRVIGDVKKRTFSEKTGGFIDFLTDDLTDFDKRGVDEKTGAGKPKTYGKFFGGIADIFTGNMFDFDKSGDFINSREDLEEMKKIAEFNKERRGVGLDPIKSEKKKRPKKGLMRLLPFNLGGEVKDNDNDTSNNNEDSVPAILTPGEFVVTKDAVDKVGVDALKGLNASVGATNEPTFTTGYRRGQITPEELIVSSKKIKKKVDQRRRGGQGGNPLGLTTKRMGGDEFKKEKLFGEDYAGISKRRSIKTMDVIDDKHFTTEDGTEVFEAGQNIIKEKIVEKDTVSIALEDIMTHQDDLLKRIRRVKGYENVTIEDVINDRVGMPDQQYVRLLGYSDAAKATKKKGMKPKRLIRKNMAKIIIIIIIKDLIRVV